MKTEMYDFFYRTETTSFDKTKQKCSVSIELEAGLSLFEALRQAYMSNKLGSGTGRSGCSEVHCDRGIWIHTNDSRIDVSTDRRAAKTVFASWDAMEADELNGGSGDAVDCGTPEVAAGKWNDAKAKRNQF